MKSICLYGKGYNNIKRITWLLTEHHEKIYCYKFNRHYTFEQTFFYILY